MGEMRKRIREHTEEKRQAGDESTESESRWFRERVSESDETRDGGEKRAERLEG